MKKFGLLISMAISSLLPFYANAEEIGDSLVSVINDWEVGNYAKYSSYSQKITIMGGDTIVEDGPETITNLKLIEILPDDDKVFLLTTEMPDSLSIGTGATGNSKEELYAKLMKATSRPIKLLTDFSGELKDIYGYDDFRADLDSCFADIKAMVREYKVPDDQKPALLLNLQQMWDSALSKENLMKQTQLFRYFGYNYPFGSSVEQVKLPVSFSDKEVDATVTFSCDLVETQSGIELISLSSNTSYDSDQLMDLITSPFISEQQKREAGLTDPNRPYMSITASEQYLIEPESGTMIQIVTERRSSTPEKTVIDYSVTSMLEAE